MRLLVPLILLTSFLAGCGSQTQPTVDDVASQHPLRASDFSWTPGFPKVDQPVTFVPAVKSAASGDSLQGVLWRIEGRTYNEHQAVHRFGAAGDHSVSMTVRTAKGGDYEVAHRVTVLPADEEDPTAPPPPQATEPPQIAVVQTGHIVNLSFTWGLEADQVHWDLGDGATSSADAPSHAYRSRGVFDVVLRVASGARTADATTAVNITEVPFVPRVVVGVTDTGINPYHLTYYRPWATDHPCTYVQGYDDCSIAALPLTVGPDGGTYAQRLVADDHIWKQVRPMTWYWIPQTNIIAVHCPEPFTGDATSTQTYDDPQCILDDTQTHGTQTTSSVLSEAPEALLVFNEGSGSQFLRSAPVPIDIESNSWGSAPLYAGLAHPAGVSVCNDSIDSPFSIKLRSAGNNGPVPNMGDCWRNGYRSYSVAGGYPEGQHGFLSGSTPDFASYWCRPAADPHHVSDVIASVCGTSFAAPTAAGTVAAALLEVRKELGFLGGSSRDEVAPGISHEDLMEAVAWAATYEPTTRPGFPASTTLGYPTTATPWLFWGWGWLHAEQVPVIVDCVMGRACPDNKSPEAWAFNDVRRSFAADE